jgi:vancomycin resistance protein YoaR
MKIGARLTTISIIFLFGAGAMTLAAFRHAPEDIIPEGVSIGDINVGGKTVQDVTTLLENWRHDALSQTIALNLPPECHSTHIWAPAAADLGLDVDINATINDALSIPEQQGMVSRVIGMVNGPKDRTVPIHWTLNDQAALHYLKLHLNRIAQIDPRDARFLPTGEGFKVIPQKDGRELDFTSCLNIIKHILDTPLKGVTTLPVRSIKPHILTSDFKGIETVIARYQTHYGERGNRAKNIVIACQKINGTLLKPGDIFSYNKIVGPRDGDAGFMMAPVIIHGKLTPGMGGGVCQVSSTLYNAALIGNLQIVQRTHHAFPVHYLPAGRDATVAYGSIDLQFKNNTDHSLLIAASGTDGRVVMRIYGKKEPGQVVHIERAHVSSWAPPTEIIHTNSLPPGKKHTVDKGKYGHRVTVIRSVYQYGKLIRKEVVSQDYYRPIPNVVEIGSAKSSPAQTSANGSANSALAAGKTPIIR